MPRQSNEDPLSVALEKAVRRQPLSDQEQRLLAAYQRAVIRCRPLFGELLDVYRETIKLTRSLARVLDTKTGRAFLGNDAAKHADELRSLALVLDIFIIEHIEAIAPSGLIQEEQS